MSMFVPVLLIGALASTALALESPSFASDGSPVKGTPQQVVPMESDAEIPGLGAYLIGAVADISGSPSIALEGYLRALSEDSSNIELRLRTFELALMAGDIPNAIRLVKTLPEKEQTTVTRLVLMADYAHEGKVAEARKAARQIAKVSPELLQFRLLQVYLDYANGAKLEDLIKWLDSQELPPSMAGRRDYHVARLWLKAGKPEKALELLKRSHAAEPGSVAGTILLGQVLARQGQPDVAAAVYDSFRAENPAVALLVPEGKDILAHQPEPFASTLDDDLASALSDFGLLIWAQGAFSPARQVLNLSLWLNPDDVYTRYYTGMLLEMGNDLAGASVHYQYLIDEPDAPEGVQLSAKIRLAEVQFREGDEETSWKSLRVLAKQYPDVPGLQKSVAQLAFNRGEYRQAIASYTHMLENLPTQTPPEARAELLYARGATYERWGEPEKATADLKAALALMPTNPQILNYLGYMWVDENINIKEAFEMLQKAHLLAPQDGAITDSLGWAYYRQGQYDTAIAYLTRATEQDPESAEIYDHLGDAYMKLGREDEARREWQRAVDLAEAGKPVPNEGFLKAVKKKLK